MMAIMRESTGIRKFDSMLEGGFPKGSVIGLTGPPGIGKSIFNLHFILEGARLNQKCVFISLEEPRSNIDRMIQQFEFADEFYRYEKKKKIIIKCMDYQEYEKAYFSIFNIINKDKKIERLVIDSFNVFFASLISVDAGTNSNELAARRMINKSFSLLRRDNLTTLIVLEKLDNHKVHYSYNIPYMVDGIVSMDFLSLGAIERMIFIPKMRWTNQYKESISYDISSKGIKILQEEE
ncbi:MAG: ATP-binding protein [Nanoarchaeota archaeon]|nr:ATP-binding protein [Nanoarchaeota archaeon]